MQGKFVRTGKTQQNSNVPPFHSCGEFNIVVSKLLILKEREKAVVKFFEPLRFKPQSLHDISEKLPSWNCDEHHRYRYLISNTVNVLNLC